MSLSLFWFIEFSIESQSLVVSLEYGSEFFLILFLEVFVLEWVLESFIAFWLFGLVIELWNKIVKRSIEFDKVSSEDEVVIVEVFNERFYSYSSFDFILSHFLSDLSWVSLNTEDKTMAELLVLSTVVVVGDYYGFLSCISAWVDYYYLALSL